MKAYLSGGMENAPELGRAWRDEMTAWLNNQLGHTVFNPVEVQNGILTTEEFENFRSWRFNQHAQFKLAVRKLIKRDLDAIDNEIDYVICYWDETVLKGGGTHGEVTLAHRMGIPVYLVMNMPFDDVSSWILGCCEGEFDSFVDLKQFLVEEYSG